MQTNANSRGIRLNARTLMLAQLGTLVAIMFIFHATGIGFITLGPVRMTIMWVPVIIGAITLGPIAGAVLGGVFGITVLLDMGALTQILIDTNPVLTVFFMVVVRGIFVGAVSGFMFKGFSKLNKKRTWSFEVTGFLTALLNTTMFILGTVIIFGSHTGMHAWLSGVAEFLGFEFAAEGATRMTVLPALLTLVGTQAFIEMGICTLLAATIARIIKTHIHKGEQA
jgi:uncharacterized membrane protein